MTLRKNLPQFFFVFLLIALLGACGGSSDGDSGGGDTSGGDTGGGDTGGGDTGGGDTGGGDTGGGDTGGGDTTIPTLAARADIEAPDGFRISDITLNASGDQVAVLFQALDPTLAASGVFGDEYSLQVFNSATGSLVETMNDPGIVNTPLELFWSDNQISLLLFPGLVSWNAQTGAVTQSETTSGVSDCDFIGTNQVFDADANVLYVGQVGFSTEICVIDFTSFGATAVDLQTSASATRISGMTLTPDNSELIVSFENDAARNDNVQTYDAQTLATVGAARDGSLGAIISAGDGFELYLDELDLTLQPLGTVIQGFDNDVVTSANSQVMSLHDNDMVRFIALPEIVYIGEATLDIDSLRSVSEDGSVAAIVIERERLEIHDLTSQSSVSAVEPPITFPRQFAGTLTIDGLAEELTGTCDVEVDAALNAPVQILVEATTTSGAQLFVRGVGVGADNAFYTYTEGGIEYSHSWILAANLSLEPPVLGTDGTSITGSTLLYTFDPNEFFELLADPADPTGFATRSLNLDAVCTL